MRSPLLTVRGNAVAIATTGGAQMPYGSFPVEVVAGVPVVVAPEEIDVSNAEVLRSALVKAAEDGSGTLVVDMTRTRFCDSAGLHVLLAEHQRAEAEGREVLLVIPSTAVLRILAITGADRMIPNFTSLPEALTGTAATANGDRERNEGDSVPNPGRGQAPAGELPGTIKRSSMEAQETFSRALAGAVKVHGEGDQALRAAYVEFKRTFEKCGDHWIPKTASKPRISVSARQW
jgi:anti-sigma B factor antagonist